MYLDCYLANNVAYSLIAALHWWCPVLLIQSLQIGFWSRLLLGSSGCSTSSYLCVICMIIWALQVVELCPLAHSTLKQCRAFSVVCPSIWNGLRIMLHLLHRNNFPTFHKPHKSFIISHNWIGGPGARFKFPVRMN